MSTDKEMTPQTTVDSVNLESIDDFLPMPGAESIVTSDGESEEKNNIFTKPNKSVDMSFIDKTDETKETKETTTSETKEVLEDLDKNLVPGSEEELEGSNAGRKKIDKSGMVDTFSKLIDEGMIIPFDDGKDLADYTMKDWKELLQANFEEKEKAVREQTPKEFFESLPSELQYAAEYVARGGTDMKGLFQALAQTEEMMELDPSNENHQEYIVRQYLQATNFGSGDTTLIEEQIQEWAESGTLNKKANQFKPKLDQMQEKVLQSKLAQQEAFRQEQVAKKEQYMNNIYNTLKPADLNGIKLDNKRQKFLWDELTTVKYGSMSGRPTNLLGKLLEEYQFGQQPRYDLIAETLWLLSDPDDYKENIKKQVKNELTQETVRKLKTEEARKISSTVHETDDDTPSRSSQGKKINRAPNNIFKRS